MGIEQVKNRAGSYAISSENIETKTENAQETQFTSQSLPENNSAGRAADNMTDDQAKNVGSNTQIRKAVEEINKKAHNSEAVFGIHDATNRVTIKIIDKESKEVLKEYPPEKTLDMIAKLWEVAGLLVDEKL